MASSLNAAVDLERDLPLLGSGLEIIARRRLGDVDDARDAVQETMARLVVRVRARGVADRPELERVAYGILRHVVVDLLRKRGREAPLDDAIRASATDALAALIASEQRQRLRAAFASLPAADRRLLERCFVDGERIGEIASASGEPAERMRKRKSRALARLTQALRGSAGHDSTPNPIEEE